MRKIELKELKVIQLDITQALHDFCADNDLKYSLADGTLLGAVRHNGYIPWDDDIDVFLLRKDYQKLQKLFPKKYKGYLDFVTLETDEKWDRPYGKIHDTRTIMKENTSSPYELGINIDVFPLDDVPDNEDEWLKYDKKRHLFRQLFDAKFVKLSSNRSLMKNLILALSKFILLPVSTRQYAFYLSRLAQKYDGQNMGRLYDTTFGLLKGNHPFAKSDFESVVLRPFEDRQFYIMNGWDDCLTNIFGDYMQLPPAEKRVSHHAFEAYWKE